MRVAGSDMSWWIGFGFAVLSKTFLLRLWQRLVYNRIEKYTSSRIKGSHTVQMYFSTNFRKWEIGVSFNYVKSRLTTNFHKVNGSKLMKTSEISPNHLISYRNLEIVLLKDNWCRIQIFIKRGTFLRYKGRHNKSARCEILLVMVFCTDVLNHLLIFNV